MTLNETHIFRSNLVNEVRFGFNRIDITFEPNAKLNPLDYGINDGVTTAIGIPQITIVGPGLNFGGPSNFPQGRKDTSFVLSDSASYLRGNHSIKLGGEFRRIKNDNFTSDTGTFQFPQPGGVPDRPRQQLRDHPRRSAVERSAISARPVRAGQLPGVVPIDVRSRPPLRRHHGSD